MSDIYSLLATRYSPLCHFPFRHPQEDIFKVHCRFAEGSDAVTVQDDAAQKFGLGLVVANELRFHRAVDNLDTD
ncbi:MAG: hypothetical protein LASZOEIN_001468, partial [Candidatus Fervidibacter sp.]